ncbi:hypothetical protein OKW41_003071 [Paraburkholderia sp. UCT70]
MTAKCPAPQQARRSGNWRKVSQKLAADSFKSEPGPRREPWPEGDGGGSTRHRSRLLVGRLGSESRRALLRKRLNRTLQSSVEIDARAARAGLGLCLDFLTNLAVQIGVGIHFTISARFVQAMRPAGLAGLRERPEY